MFGITHASLTEFTNKVAYGWVIHKKLLLRFVKYKEIEFA